MTNDILAKKTIVLIEDDHTLSDIIVQKLRLNGATVYAYTNGLEGLAAIRHKKPDIVLLDVMLPIMNGYEVLAVMQKEDLICKHPVLVISNSGQEVEVDRVHALGASDYLVKADFTPNEVIEKARALLTQHATPISNVVDNLDTEKSFTRPHVLVIEDDPMLRNILSMKFSHENIAFVFINEGEQAFELAKQELPNVILLDLMLPGKDGFTILKELRADDATATIPVIVFSNRSEESEREQAIQLGAVDFRVKAMTDLNELVKQIKSLSS